MIVKKADRKTLQASSTTIVYEYPFPDKDLSMAIITINGRYPDKGRTLNEKSKEIIYVISGSGKVLIEDEVFEVSEGDQVFVPNNVKFHYRDCKNMTVAVPTTPAFDPAQHKFVD